MKKWNAPVVEELAVNETAGNGNNGNGMITLPDGTRMHRKEAMRLYPEWFDSFGNYIGADIGPVNEAS